MKIEEFVTRLEELGFVHVGNAAASDPLLRCYEPPANLRRTLYSLNMGKGQGQYSVTFQPQTPEGRAGIELGNPFPLCEPNEELLSALERGGEEFLRWFYSRPVYSFELHREDGTSDEGVITRGGTAHHAPKSIN